MPEKNGPPTTLEARKKEGRIPRSHSIVPPPPTPYGYSLKLVGNIPQYLTEKEQKIAKAKIAFGQQEILKQGSWDGIHVNIVSAVVNNGVIEYVTAPGRYFQQRLAIDGTTPYETKRKLTHAGATLFVITGNNKIALSSRPDNVQIYPRMLCATASGSWDGGYQKNLDGTDSPLLIPPTPEDAKRHVKAELHDETGLPYDIINAQEMQMIGVAEEAEKGHWDFLWKWQAPKDITEQRMREFHHKEKTNGNGHDVDPTAGHLIFIDNTPAGIERFLSDIHTPWDPLSERGLLHLGHGLILQQQFDNHASMEAANFAANQWMYRVEDHLQEKYIKINQIVRTHRRDLIHQARKDWVKAATEQTRYTFKPQERILAVMKRRRAGAKVEEYMGYSRNLNLHKTPESQGISGIKQELQRTGRIAEPTTPTTPSSTH